MRIEQKKRFLGFWASRRRSVRVGAPTPARITASNREVLLEVLLGVLLEVYCNIVL